MPETPAGSFPLDSLDQQIIELFRTEPRIGVLEISRRLEIARGTVQSRLEKMMASGVICGFGPDIDLSKVGLGVVGFTTIEVAQGRTEEVVAHLMTIPNVLEAHAIAGQGDLLVRLSAGSNEDLMEALTRVLSSPAVDRASTAIGLANHIPYRTAPIIAHLTDA